LTNGGLTSLSMTFRSTNPSHWTADLAIGFYGTNQFYGGCGNSGCNCGYNSVGSFPSQYRQFINSDIPLFTTSISLYNGLNAICLVNTCSGGQCSDTNTFNGTLTLECCKLIYIYIYIILLFLLLFVYIIYNITIIDNLSLTMFNLSLSINLS